MLAENAVAEMSALADRIANESLTPLWPEVTEVAHQSFRDNFTSSASPDGLDWPPRKRIGDGHPLLIDTGALLQAVVDGGPGNITAGSDRQLTLGVDGSVIPYAATHNYGREEANIPEREFLGLKVEHEDQIEDMIAGAIEPLFELG